MQFKHIIAAAFFLSMTPLAQAQPDAAASKLDLCNQAVEEGDSAKAIAAAEDVLKQDAHNREALLCKARALGAAGQYQQAMEAMQAGEQRSVTPIDHMVALTLTGMCSAMPSTMMKIGRAHVCTPVTNAHIVCRLLLEKKTSMTIKKQTHLIIQVHKD